MCCGENYGGGYRRGGSNGYAWARAITTVVVVILFLGTLYAATRSEVSGVFMTPKQGCILVTGNRADYVVKRGTKSDCDTQDAVLWADMETGTFPIIYQEQDGALFCLADHCAGTRRKCDVDRVTLDLCDATKPNQYWTQIHGKKQIYSAAAIADPLDARRCLSSASSARSILTNEAFLRMDVCDVLTGKSSNEQEWEFLGSKPTPVNL